MVLQRRARPLLGTLVEIGWDGPGHAGADAFDAIAHLQRTLSRFEADSEIARFNRLKAGESLRVAAPTAHVLGAAALLTQATGGVFDITLGCGARAWRLQHGILHKLERGLQLDLGGIAKGYAVDQALAVLGLLEHLAATVQYKMIVRSNKANNNSKWSAELFSIQLSPFVPT